MDIIKLYEANKPYPLAIEISLNNAYNSLLDERKLKYKILIGFGLACMITTPKKQFFKGLIKIGLLGLVGVSLVEASIWNKFFLKLYLVQK
jgi:hypothetical protein